MARYSRGASKDVKAHCGAASAGPSNEARAGGAARWKSRKQVIASARPWAGIHVFARSQGVDGRDKPGHCEINLHRKTL
jgi:hypothetical protein